MKIAFSAQFLTKLLLFSIVAIFPVAMNASSPLGNRAESDSFGSQGVLGHFTWGADLGSSVDMTAHDMSTFEISSCFGYKNAWMRFLGVGASIESMLNNSSRCYPVYAMIRTSFSRIHRFCFLELRGGVSFNEVADLKSEIDPYATAGLGFTMAHSRKFTSHVVVRCIWHPLKRVEFENEMKRDYDLWLASISLGCAF